VPECRSKDCKAELMWKQPYHPGDRPVNPDGTKHVCRATFFGNLENWKKKWDTVFKFQVPHFCNICQRSFKPHNICSHMRADGFIEGVDTVEFYSDKWTAVKRREHIRYDKRKSLEPKKPKTRRKINK